MTATLSVSPCGPCGLCCRSYIVPIAGMDLWVISRARRLPPSAFAIACPQAPGEEGGFRLVRGGERHFLALDKQRRFRVKAPCVFLMRLANGEERCGVYDYRPSVCQAYPMVAHGVGWSIQDEALCGVGVWSAAAIARPSWARALQRQRLRFDLDSVAIQRWNMHVDATEREFHAQEYITYLLNVMERLATLAEGVEPAMLDEVEATWNQRPPGYEQATVEELLERRPPWLAYLLACRQAIEGFFPELGPFPPLRLVPVDAPQPPRTRLGGPVHATGTA